MKVISYQKRRQLYDKETKEKINFTRLRLYLVNSVPFRVIKTSGENITRDIVFRLLRSGEKMVNLGDNQGFHVVNAAKGRLYDQTNANYLGDSVS